MTTAPRFTLLAAGAAAIAALSGCSAKDASTQANLVRGKQLFVGKCGACHTLAHAGTKGTQGPNLDHAFANPVKEGFGSSAIRGLVREQIAHPYQPDGRIVQMPANLVTGQDRQDVAAYVASVVARPGQDAGLLATAVQSAQSSKPAVEQNGTLTIPADPSGQLAYVFKTAQAKAGKVTIAMPNRSSSQHNIAIDGKGAGKIVGTGGTSTFSATFAPGTYTFYCQVPGHRQAGMVGKLVVK
jgi:mono/diheme cytochrome c family protein